MLFYSLTAISRESRYENSGPRSVLSLFRKVTGLTGCNQHFIPIRTDFFDEAPSSLPKRARAGGDSEATARTTSIIRKGDDMRTTLSAIVSATLALVAIESEAAAPAEREVQLAIEQQVLADALNAWAQQTGLQLVSPSSEVTNRIVAPQVKGVFSAQAALEKLLDGTPVTYVWLNERSVAIREKTQAELVPIGTNATPFTSRLAVLDVRPEAVEGAGDAPQSRDGTHREGTATSAETEDGKSEQVSGKGIPEVLVVGSRILNADIRRTEDDVQPYVVFDRTQIDRSMSGNVEAFLKSRLPMNTLETSNSQGPGSSGGSQSTINLRGLGANQTLILIDGRRVSGVSNSGELRQPDINGIPLAAIERIEVLPSTASGIYGGGATGGVVNIITRKDYAGVDLSTTYGNTFESDAGYYRVDASAGFTFEDGRSHLLVAASHAAADTLLNGDREFARRARARQLATNPAAFYDLSTPPLGLTSNIRSADGSNLVLDNGTPLNSPLTHIPQGYAGPAADGGNALVANAGLYNLDLSDDLGGRRQGLFNGPTVSSALVSARRGFTEALDAFADLSYFDNEGRIANAGLPGPVVLAADAPNNPFTTPIVVRFPSPGLARELGSDAETVRAVGGLIARLPGSWTAGLDYAWSRSRYSFFQTSPVVGDPDGAGPGLGAAAAYADGTLDIMRDLNGSPLDYSSFLLPSPNQTMGPFDSVLTDLNLRASGRLGELPGGPLTLSALIESRKEEAEDAFASSMSENAATAFFFFPHRSQKVESFYLETRAPLVSGSNAMPMLRELELQASVRHDRYETTSPDTAAIFLPSRDAPRPAFGYVSNEVDATKYTLGLRYAPVTDVVLRASFGTGFLPPSISQIVPGTPFPGLSATLIDPKRGSISQTIFPVALTFGGSPSLKAEESESWSVGMIYSPRVLPRLRLSVDYTQIEKTNEIAFLTVQQLVDLEGAFPSRIVRAPLSPADQALGYTGGVITAIDQSQINVASTDVEAYDVQVDYTYQAGTAGEFHAYAVATWQSEFERRSTPGSPPVDSVGFAQGPLHLRGSAGIDWELGSWTAGWNAQYFDSYRICSALAPPVACSAIVVNQGGAEIPDQLYHDIFARYRFPSATGSGSGLLEGVEIAVGIQNVLDKEPPTLATTASGGTDTYSNYADPRLRRFTLTVQKRF